MLVLPIKKQWYDMILSGLKKEEYREIKPYYTKRFQTIGLLDKEGTPTKSHCNIIFRNGYSKASPSFIATCSLSIKEGRTEWGAVPEIKYYALEIKSVIEKT